LPLSYFNFPTFVSKHNQKINFVLKSLTAAFDRIPYEGTRFFRAMTTIRGWVSVQRAEELLGIDRKTLFKYRDNGTLKLGPHYAAFPETRSRDSYRWNTEKVRKHLQKQGLMPSSV
jgi:hypothetical protein